jgi:D-lyxose ketol-isomerase
MKYELKKLKQMKTRNGVALTADLYRDGSQVGYLEDLGNGGGLSIVWNEGHWQNAAEENNVIEYYKNTVSDSHWTKQFFAEAERYSQIEMACEWIIEKIQIEKANKRKVNA